jgi:hypothetical protein
MHHHKVRRLSPRPELPQPPARLPAACPSVRLQSVRRSVHASICQPVKLLRRRKP